MLTIIRNKQITTRLWYAAGDRLKPVTKIISVTAVTTMYRDIGTPLVHLVRIGTPLVHLVRIGTPLVHLVRIGTP